MIDIDPAPAPDPGPTPAPDPAPALGGDVTTPPPPEEGSDDGWVDGDLAEPDQVGHGIPGNLLIGHDEQQTANAIDAAATFAVARWTWHPDQPETDRRAGWRSMLTDNGWEQATSSDDAWPQIDQIRAATADRATATIISAAPAGTTTVVVSLTVGRDSTDMGSWTEARTISCDLVLTSDGWKVDRWQPQ